METVNPRVPSTIEAAALCKMADRGQITGGILDGPLARDNAISPEAAEIKGIASPGGGNQRSLFNENMNSALRMIVELRPANSFQSASWTTRKSRLSPLVLAWREITRAASSPSGT